LRKADNRLMLATGVVLLILLQNLVIELNYFKHDIIRYGEPQPMFDFSPSSDSVFAFIDYDA